MSFPDAAAPTSERPLVRLLSSVAPVVIAHRGGARLRPENTLEAFEHALTLGVDALECDVHLSRDGDAVVIHDPTLDRTTDARGPVRAWTAADLASVDAGYRFEVDAGFPFRGRGIGKALLVHLANRAVREGCGRFEWWVLDWNEPSIGFYKSLGARPMDEWTVMRVAGPALAALAGNTPA